MISHLLTLEESNHSESCGQRLPSTDWSDDRRFMVEFCSPDCQGPTWHVKKLETKRSSDWPDSVVFPFCTRCWYVFLLGVNIFFYSPTLVRNLELQRRLDANECLDKIIQLHGNRGTHKTLTQLVWIKTMVPITCRFQSCLISQHPISGHLLFPYPHGQLHDLL